MTHRHYILATAGHVDHGKSSLVKALTGTDPDRLPEEKARGITIDLGFAHLELAVPGPPPLTCTLGIVDVPGHEDFVKNMVAGVGSIDLALLVVAADDGWMPQTEEHLQILSYLDVRHAVVALTKADLAGDQEGAVIAAVRERLESSPFAASPIVPTSVLTGRGLEELKAALLDVLARTPHPRDVGKARLPVDRVFTLRGIGTVVTGTLNGGALRRGQGVVIQPAGTPARVRSLQSHNREVELSGPGTRTAVNLPDIAASGAGETTVVARGDVITLAELGAASPTWDVRLEKSPRVGTAKSGAARALRDGALVRVHHGSGNWPARVLFFESGELTPGEQKLAQLRFRTPAFALAGDRFIVRDWSELATLAGGLVLEPEGRRKDWRGPPQRRFLEARARAPGDVGAFLLSHLERAGAALRVGLLLRTRFSASEIAGTIARLVTAREVVACGDWLAAPAWWRELVRRAGATIDAAHQAHPEHAGLPLREFRAALADALPLPGVFEALVAELCGGGFQQTGNAIARAAHRPALPPHLQGAGERLRATLAAKPLEPPSRKELAPDNLSQQALRFLLQTGEAIELSAEIVLAADAWTRAKEIICEQLRQRGAATVSELRQVLGSSRRIMVPLLERLDREGLTRREGDVRRLGPKA